LQSYARVFTHALAQGAQDGCTATACLVRNGGEDTMGWNIWIANAGNSRTVLVKADHSVIQVTTDHTPNDSSEKARILASGGSIVFRDGCWRVNGTMLPLLP
jgi:serine/threonine protein phosphatase PrpC